MNKAKIKSGLMKVKRTVSQIEKVQLSHWSWQGVVKLPDGSIRVLDNDPELQFMELVEAPPIIWEGMAGTHPLLRVIDEILNEIDN